MYGGEKNKMENKRKYLYVNKRKLTFNVRRIDVTKE